MFDSLDLVEAAQWREESTSDLSSRSPSETSFTIMVPTMLLFKGSLGDVRPNRPSLLYFIHLFTSLISHFTFSLSITHHLHTTLDWIWKTSLNK